MIFFSWIQCKSTFIVHTISSKILMIILQLRAWPMFFTSPSWNKNEMDFAPCLKKFILIKFCSLKKQLYVSYDQKLVNWVSY